MVVNRPRRPRGREHEILAGLEPGNPELTGFVGAIERPAPGHRHHPPLAAEVFPLRREDADVPQRIAELVGDPAGDRSRAWQREVGIGDALRVDQLDRAARLAGTALTVLETKVAGPRGRDAVAAPRQILELEHALRGRADRARFAEVRRRQADLHAAYRLAGIGRHDLALDRAVPFAAVMSRASVAGAWPAVKVSFAGPVRTGRVLQDTGRRP